MYFIPILKLRFFNFSKSRACTLCHADFGKRAGPNYFLSLIGLLGGLRAAAPVLVRTEHPGCTRRLACGEEQDETADALDNIFPARLADPFADLGAPITEMVDFPGQEALL